MKSRGLTGLLLAGAIGVVSSEGRAADIGNPPAAPPTAEGSAPAASPPADAPKPISAPPPPPNAPEERTAKNTIYVEGLGAGGIYSLNYERIFGDFAPRLGFEYLSVSATTSTGEAHTSLIGIPMSVSYLGIGSLTHIFEAGAGATILIVGEGASFVNVDSSSSAASGSSTLVFGTVTAGYRFQPPGGGFLFRGGVNAIIGGETPVFPWPYIALGGTF